MAVKIPRKRNERVEQILRDLKAYVDQALKNARDETRAERAQQYASFRRRHS